MMKKAGRIAATIAVLTVLLAGCGSDKSAEIEKCIDQIEQSLADAGSDRDLTQGEIDACNDDKQREFILVD